MEKTIYLDIERCVGCGACVTACMDQNDIFPDKGQLTLRSTYQIEEGKYPDAVINYISIGCLHCQDSPCIVSCPTGAIHKDNKTKAVIVNKELCIGCHSCALACPFGVPRYDLEDKLQKCDLCNERLEAGLQPACVRVCPFSALLFERINEVQEAKQSRFVTQIVKTAQLSKAAN